MSDTRLDQASRRATAALVIAGSVLALTVGAGSCRWPASSGAGSGPPGSATRTAEATGAGMAGVGGSEDDTRQVPRLVEAPAEVTGFFNDAADTVDRYEIYRPSRLPEGFELVEDASEVMGEWTVAAVVARGDMRLLIIQGAWDLGDEPARDLGAAKWGPKDASLLGDVYYAYEEEPHRGKDGYAVITAFPSPSGDTANYMVIGLELPSETVVGVARSMRVVKP